PLNFFATTLQPLRYLDSTAPCNRAEFLSAPRVIRTPDLLIRSQTLYPTELWARGEERLVLAGVSAVNSVPQRRRGGQLTEFSPIRGSQRASRPLPSHVETLTSPLACRDAPKSPLQPPGGRGATLPPPPARR